jgi:cytoskeletal protein CcmA (bactofilin family)
LFGKKKKPRKEIRLTCPFCGAGQTEPALALSSFCRSCGEHFRIEKGVAQAPPGARVSGIVPIYKNPQSRDGGENSSGVPEPSCDYSEYSGHLVRPARREASGNPRGSGQSWLGEAREKRLETVRARQSARTRETGKDRPKEISEAAKQRNLRQPIHDLIEDIDGEVDADRGGKESGALGAAAQPAEALKEGSMEALLGSALEKMKTAEAASAPVKLPPNVLPGDKKKRNEPEKRPVRCFKCNHQQTVSWLATSTQCARCSVYISLLDHEITSLWSQNIRTRGNIVVTRRGALVGCDVACHHLTVAGNISASVDCSGNAHFKHSGKVMGSMFCGQLIVDKKCQAIFPQGVFAESADIHGTIEGNVTCSGTIRIYRTGAVLGDAVARAVILKDGGVLTGNMSIQPDLVIDLSEKKGYSDKYK